MPWIRDQECEYGLLADEDEKHDAALTYLRGLEDTSQQWSRTTKILLFATAMAIPIGVILLRAFLFLDEPVLRSCGHTSTEARALGCSYDVMMDSWLPPACFDEELTKEFQAQQDWPFYADKNATRRMTAEEMSERGQAFVHTTIEYHFVHCLFAFRKLHRAMEYGFLIEREVAELGHTDHCANFLASTERRLENPEDLPSLSKIGTKLPVAFPTCISATNLLKGYRRNSLLYN